jgi:cold shock CspA family protein
MSDTNSHVIGRVKWFNNKVGYGFVSVTEGEYKDTDIFVHHSVIRVGDQQYRYLVQGEYVELEITAVQGGKYDYQASLVCGIRGGILMCETRNETKLARNDYISKKIDDKDILSKPILRRSSNEIIDGNDGWSAPKQSVKRKGRPHKNEFSI